MYQRPNLFGCQKRLENLQRSIPPHPQFSQESYSKAIFSWQQLEQANGLNETLSTAKTKVLGKSKSLYINELWWPGDQRFGSSNQGIGGGPQSKWIIQLTIVLHKPYFPLVRPALSRTPRGSSTQEKKNTWFKSPTQPGGCKKFDVIFYNYSVYRH